MASVALHDWQSYATMRALAEEKYGLSIIEDHLPGHSLEQVSSKNNAKVFANRLSCFFLQGRDILEIIRNLPQFISQFTYNLNNQVFIQTISQNKHLDTLNIRHVANSLRTHGIGLTNTGVNAVYQFLRRKMTLFSQSLFQEQIKSRLAKDLRLWKNERGTSTQGQGQSSSSSTTTFPFKTAEKFKKGIRKFGMTSTDSSLSVQLSWLDKFRILVTQIGNARG